jgi:hypothetical protein
VDLTEELERAYAAGDHLRARALARSLLAEARGEAQHGRARAILAATEIDWFLPRVGLLGLGLVAWLVYNYWL